MRINNTLFKFLFSTLLLVGFATYAATAASHDEDIGQRHLQTGGRSVSGRGGAVVVRGRSSGGRGRSSGRRGGRGGRGSRGMRPCRGRSCGGRRPIGGGRDPYGCITSAGYSWCASLQQCIRSWETNCPGGGGGGGIVCPAVYDPVICFGEYSAEFSNQCEANAAGYSDFQCRSTGGGGGGTPGGDRDQYGCIPSAGYSWCASLQQCIRPFETNCPGGGGGGTPGGDRDQYGCIPSAGYSWCPSLQQCIRSWETNCPGGGGGGGIACPFVYDPVICFGIEFSNQCEANAAGYSDYQCSSTGGGGGGGIACPLIYDPVFCFGIEFSNQCEANAAGYSDYQCSSTGGGGGGGRCPSSCYQPVVVGNCYAAIPAWAYNSRTRRCEEFLYGGCGGNGNNFGSPTECNSVCGGC